MRMGRVFFAAALAAAFLPICGQAQFYTLTPEQLAKYTAQWTGERFPDGRPKVPDARLEKVKALRVDDVGIARQGYQNQYVDTLRNINPGKKLVGRAVTLQLGPDRPDVSGVIQSEWRAKGNGMGINHQTALDTLQAGDVMVIDSYGSVPVGGIVGDNLAYYTWKKTGNGFVIDGPIRDLEGISEFGMAGYYKGATPPAIHGTMVMGINVPVRIGATTVMPGDVVLGDREGIYFIPPHLVNGVVDAAEVTRLSDEWTHKKIDEGKKSSDLANDPALQKELQAYLIQKVGQQRYDDYVRQQQAAPAGRGMPGMQGMPPRKQP